MLRYTIAERAIMAEFTLCGKPCPIDVPMTLPEIPSRMRNDRLALACLAVVIVALGISSFSPFDRLTWWLETAPVFIAIPLVLATWKRFPLTSLLVILISVHALILILGAHYTYARVPLGDWISTALGWERNHYDRLGHVAQGFVPAIIAREILLRTSPLKPGAWLFYITVSVCLAFSAFYEMLEWWAAVIGGGKSEDFLGTQGDPWDTQWDMFLAMSGAIVAQLLLSRWHYRQMRDMGVVESADQTKG